MKNLYLVFAFGILFFACGKRNNQIQTNSESENMKEYSIVIHGGAGNIAPGSISAERVKEYENMLSFAVDSGARMLERGDSALNVVEAVIRLLEDSPLFNAGKGAVLTAQGTFELDASIMDGSNLNAGAVTNLRRIQNPISLARMVMERSEHVMLSGTGAEQFAVLNQTSLVDTNYFFTQNRYDSWLKLNSDTLDKKHGTVGCAVKDKYGNLASGTSTGGMMNKKYGRIGDAPIIGAGTYASNVSCAVSCTGHGEFFIRYTVARSVAALMEYAHLSLDAAADSVVFGTLMPVSGNGGLIAVDKFGNISMTFNTSAMFRAAASSDGYKFVGIFDEE